MRTFKTIGLLMFVVLVGLVACTSQPTSPTQSIVASPSQTLTQPVETPAPTHTPTPSVPPLPFEPVGVGTPPPENLEPITVDKVDRLVEIARWGKGYAGSAAWTSDGRYIVVPAGHGIYFYDADTGAEARYLPVVKWENYASKTDTITILGGDDPLVLHLEDQVLFDSTAVVQAIPSPQGQWVVVMLADDIRTYDELLVLDSETGELLTTLPVVPAIPVEIAFSSDGKYLAAGTECGRIQVWEVVGSEPRLEQFAEYLAHDVGPDDLWCDKSMKNITFSPDNQWLAATAGDGMVWPVKAGTHRPSFVLVNDYDRYPADTVAFSPDSQWVVFGGGDGVLRGWNLEQQARFRDQPVESENEYNITALHFTPEGTLMVGTLSSGVLAWDMQEESVLGRWSKYPSEVQDIKASPTGGRVLVKHENSIVEIIDPNKAEPVVTITDHLGPVHYKAAYTSEGGRLALSIDDTIYILNSTTGRVEATLVGDGSDAPNITFSPDGRLLAAGYDSGALLIWDVEQGSVAHTLIEPQEGVTFPPKVAFSPDGALLASTPPFFGPTEIMLWNPATGAKVRTVMADSDFVVGEIGFSPDGDLFFYTEVYTKTIFLYDTTQWREVLTLPSEQDAEGWNMEPVSAVFSADSRKIAAADSSFSAVFDVEDQSLLWKSPLGGPFLTFSPDATLLLLEDSATLARADTGEALRSLYNASPFSVYAFFSSDGTKIYIVGGDGIVRVWGIPR